MWGETSGLNTKQVAINLRTLHSLSKINKQDWLKLINEYGFDLNIEPRDSSRNIIGKLLSYLDANPQAIDTLKRKVENRQTAFPPSIGHSIYS